MCLYLTKQNKEPKVAEKPIECYKLVLRRAYNRLVTPFMHCEIDLGEVIKAYPRVPMVQKSEYASKYSRHKFFVGVGVIHTFKTLVGAKKAARMLFFSSDIAIVKCTIPTGSLYFEGVFDDTGIQCYASTSVRYWKKIVYQK